MIFEHLLNPDLPCQVFPDYRCHPRDRRWRDRGRTRDHARTGDSGEPPAIGDHDELLNVIQHSTFGTVFPAT